MAFNMQFNLRRKDPGTPWGFRVGGGMDAQHGFQQLFVERVARGGLAERAGMQAFDRLEFIGGDDARLMTQIQATQAIILCGNELGLEVARSPGVAPPAQQPPPPAAQRQYPGQYSAPGGPGPGFGMGQMGQLMSPERRGQRRYVPSPTLDTLPMASPYGPQPYSQADNFNPWRSSQPQPPAFVSKKLSSACVTLERRPPQQYRDFYTVPRTPRSMAAAPVSAGNYDMGPSASATDPTPYWSSRPPSRDFYNSYYSSASPYNKSSYSSSPAARPSGPPPSAWPSSASASASPWADDRTSGTCSTQESGYNSYTPSRDTRGRGSVPPAEHLSQPRRGHRASSCVPGGSNETAAPSPPRPYAGVSPGFGGGGGVGGSGTGKPPPIPSISAGMPKSNASPPARTGMPKSNASPPARTGMSAGPSGGAVANGASGHFTSAPGKRLAQGRRGEAVLNTLEALNATVSVVPICGVCRQRIRGPFVSALDKSYCPQHFYCQNGECGANLMEIGFVEEEGRLFCEHCYARFWAPRCGGCGQVVLETAVQAMGRAWHSGCFRCSACGRSIGPGAPFHVEDGRPFCTADFESLFTPKCDACGGSIGVGDRWIDACAKRFHAACFRCSTCSTTLDGKPFVNLQGKPYCRAHGAGVGRFGVVF